MSTVSYTISRTVCEELQILRDCYKTRDFSRMAATIERIQAHANAMESALYSNYHFKKQAKEKIRLLPKSKQKEELEKLLNEVLIKVDEDGKSEEL